MSVELKGLEDSQSLIIEKLNFLRKEEIIVTDADRRFELSIRIKELDEKLSKIKIEIRKLREEEFAGLREHLQKIIDLSVNAFTSRDPHRTIEQLSDSLSRLIKMWELAFPDSHIPEGMLRTYQEQFDDLARRDITLSKWQRELVGHFIIPFMTLVESDLLEALGNKEKRAELEKAASVGVTEQECLEKAYASFKKLKFDSPQRSMFNRLFQKQQNIQYFIHGEPTHGQQWLYNRIIKFHHFFESDSGIAYFPFRLDGPLGDEDIAAVISQKLEVDTSPDEREIWFTELTEKLINKLRHQHVLVAFKNPTLDKLSEIKGLIDGVAKNLNTHQGSLAEHKAIFITILDQMVENLNFPCLKPIDADILRQWIGTGWEENDEYILKHFGNLAEDDEGRLCEALKGIHGKEHPFVPAEKFIENVAVGKFNLKWEKCKNQWLRY